jgi:hypothetical protein
MFEDVISILTRFNYSPLHDYDNKTDHIEWLGIYEEDAGFIKDLLPEGWVIVERRRNPDNDFLRVDIIKEV